AARRVHEHPLHGRDHSEARRALSRLRAGTAGHGRTTDIDRPITYPQLADDVAAFMDAVKLGKANLFGYSMGAVVGLQLAIRYPQKVNRLVAASLSCDAEGWEPECREVSPQMTVVMFLAMPFAEQYRRLPP